jgi:hypothetical protein
MKFLQISVITMFSPIMITCYYTRNYFYHHIYMLLIIFGILNHGLERKNNNGKNVIHIIDTTIACFAFFYSRYDSFHLFFMNVSFINIFIFFILEYIYPKYDHILHFLIHLQTAISMNIYFIFFNNKSHHYHNCHLCHDSSLLMSPTPSNQLLLSNNYKLSCPKNI